MVNLLLIVNETWLTNRKFLFLIRRLVLALQRLLSLFFGVFSISLVVSGGVSAQTADECACRVPINEARGLIDFVEGEVLLSRAEGFAPARVGMVLLTGDEIKTGRKSSAYVSIGSTCRLAIEENLEMSILPSLEQACIRVTKPQGTGTASFKPPIAPDLMIFGFVTAGMFIGIGLEPVSP